MEEHMIRTIGIGLAVLAIGVALYTTAGARSADQLPPLALTAQEVGPAFSMADEGPGLVEANSFRRIMQRTDMGFTSVTVILYSETEVTPQTALEQVLQDIAGNPAAMSLAEEPIEAPQGYGADASNFALGGPVDGQQTKVLVTSWRSGDVVAVVTSVAAVTAAESAEQTSARLQRYADAQRDKLTAMGLELATTMSAPPPTVTPAQP
jgi:hypothetical protein